MVNFNKSNRDALDRQALRTCANWEVTAERKGGMHLEFASTEAQARKAALSMNMDGLYGKRARIYAVLNDGRKIEVK